MQSPEQAKGEELKSARKLFESASGDNPSQLIKDFWELIKKGFIEFSLMTLEEEQVIYQTTMTIDHKTSEEEERSKVFVKISPALTLVNFGNLGPYRREALFSDCRNNMTRAVVHYRELAETGARF